MLVKLLCIAVLSTLVYSDNQLISPCPGVFEYVCATPEYWNGTLTLNSPRTLPGFWIQVFLDHKAKCVISSDNFVKVHDQTYRNFTLEENSFMLDNTNCVLMDNTPLQIPFQVVYEDGQKALLQKIRLNGLEVCCPENDD